MAQNINLLGSIGPSLFDAFSGPNIVIILCQQSHHLLMIWAKTYLAQVYWGRPVAIGLLIPDKK